MIENHYSRLLHRLWFRRRAQRFAPLRLRLIAVLPHDRGCRLQSYADGPALVDKSSLGGNSFDDIRRSRSTASRPRPLARR